MLSARQLCMALTLVCLTILVGSIGASCTSFGSAKPIRIVVESPAPYWGIDEKVAAALKADGVELYSYPDCPKAWDQLIDEPFGKYISNYNVFIVGETYFQNFSPDPATGAIPARAVELTAQLKKFLAAGGGVWFCGLGGESYGKTAITLNYMLKELGLDAEVTGEAIMDTAIMKQGEMAGKFSWAEVADDPLTRDVKNLLHPTGVVSAEGSMGVVPITRLGPDWRVLIKGNATSASFTIDLTPPTVGDKLDVSRPGVVKSNPILCAVRQAGKGRVVLWPTWTCFTVTGGSIGLLVDGERDGRKSDGGKLMENLLIWLAEPSQGSSTVGLFDTANPARYQAVGQNTDPEKVLGKWQIAGRKDYANQYKGLIGVHSNLSDGRDSPEEMIAAARKAGYDFIAFTEDLSKMTEEKWNRLLEICDKANADDRGFRVFQGLDCLDEAGNRNVVFGHRYWVTPDVRSKKYPDRIEYLYSFTYKKDGTPKRWPPRIVIRSQTNNKRPWDIALWSFFSPYCYEAGKLVDDSFFEYRKLIGPSVFDFLTGLATVHTVRSVKEVELAANPALYQFRVRADQLIETRDIENPKGVYDSLWTNCGPWRPDPETDRPQDYYTHYFPAYPSTGPEILDFRTKSLGERMGVDMAIPGNNKSMIHILVHAEAGLDAVELYDGETLVRLYRPEGKDFEHFLPAPNNEQHSYTLTVSDKNGGKAVSWPAWTRIEGRIQMRCGDNLNYANQDKPRSGKPFVLQYDVHQVPGYGQHKDGKAPRPEYNCWQAGYFHVGLNATSFYIAPEHQKLLVDDVPWPGKQNGKALIVDMETTGPYGSIGHTLVRYDYPEPNPIRFNTLSFGGPYPVVASPWPADLKYYCPFSRWNGATVSRYEGKVTFTRKISTPDGSPISVCLGGGSGGNPGKLELRSADGSFKMYDVGDKIMKLTIPVGGYACWYDEKGDGMGGIIALSPRVELTYSRKYQGIYSFVPSPADPMTEVKWDVLFVSGNTSTTDSNQQMLDVWQGMGVVGKPTMYDVKAQAGQVACQQFFLTLQAEDGGFRGQIAKSQNRLLPIHLPVWVRGLNARWDAGIWYKGKTELEVIDYHRDQWNMVFPGIMEGRCEPRTDEVRYIPVLAGGVGYCQVETDKQDPDIFVGNFLVCDQPEVFIGLNDAKPDRCTFEINNPTERELVCTVRPSKGFDYTGRWQRTVTLRPGAVQTITVTEDEK